MHDFVLGAGVGFVVASAMWGQLARRAKRIIERMAEEVLRARREQPDG